MRESCGVATTGIAPPCSAAASMTESPQLWAGERPGGVVDRDHVDLVVLDVVGEDPQRLPLRVVSLLAAVDDPEVVGAEVRGDRLGDRVPVLAAYDEDDAVHARDVEDGAHRAGQDRDPVEREQHLVGLGARRGCRTRRRG